MIDSQERIPTLADAFHHRKENQDGMNGGIADNLAMRGIINNILAYADDAQRIR
jgi:hypothetical protein